MNESKWQIDVTSDSYPGCGCRCSDGICKTGERQKAAEQSSRTALFGSAVHESLEELSTKISPVKCADRWVCRIKAESRWRPEGKGEKSNIFVRTLFLFHCHWVAGPVLIRHETIYFCLNLVSPVSGKQNPQAWFVKSCFYHLFTHLPPHSTPSQEEGVWHILYAHFEWEVNNINIYRVKFRHLG